MDNANLNFDPLASKVLTLAEKAGNLICQIYENGFDVLKKKDGSPVTQADHQSHILLKIGLESLLLPFPLFQKKMKILGPLKAPIIGSLILLTEQKDLSIRQENFVLI